MYIYVVNINCIKIRNIVKISPTLCHLKNKIKQTMITTYKKIDIHLLSAVPQH